MADDENSLDGQLAAAIEIADVAERDAFLRNACAGDSSRLAELHDMVCDYFAAGSLIERPAVLPTIAYSEIISLGQQVGAYKLRELLGEGGMGIVYVAEQETPVRRKVALKIIKPGMDSREVISRFEAERQALALMDHPNIAKIFDGGVTHPEPEAQAREEGSHSTLARAAGSNGRPYFVMELVRGLPITDHCDELKLGIRDRLSLFRQVCQAVQHAHQKGIIHRDLKPSNVIVAMHDTTAVVKVIDFGVAKAIGQQLTDHTLYTGVSQMIGTPLYMSPEQAGQSSLDVDTRSDVYSLGVLLYELLTGHTPFESETLKRAGLDEMRRMIREDEPPRPSTRVSTLQAAALSTISERRRADPQRLSRHLRGELDWIVMKALEKDRSRRYESAGALAADIERYLTDEPVQARSPSAAYRLWKFARRNRSALATATVVAIAVLVVAGNIGWGLLDTAGRRAGAEQAARAALDESADHYRADRPDAAMAGAVRAVDTLANVKGTERLLAEARQRVIDLTMAARLEDNWFKVADDGTLNTREAAIASLHTAFSEYGIDPVELSEAEAAERVRTRFIATELVASLDSWAGDRRLMNGPSDPLAVKLRAIAAATDLDPWSRRVREVNPDGMPEQLVALATEMPVATVSPDVVRRLGVILQRTGQRAEAETLLRQAVRCHPDHVGLNCVLGDLLRDSPSESTRREALEFYRAALAVRPRSPSIRSRIGTLFTEWLGRPADGAEWFREALRLKPDFHNARNNLSIALARQGKFAEAVEAAREVVEAMPSVQTYTTLGNRFEQLGRRAEAADAMRAALGFEARTANDYRSRGQALGSLGRVDEAIVAYREAIRLDPANGYARSRLGGELTKAGKTDEAIKHIGDAIKLDPHKAPYHAQLGITLRQQGRLDDAVAAYREAIRLEPRNAGFHFNLALAFFHANKNEEAEAEFRETIKLRPGDAKAFYNLGKTLYSLGRPDEAEAAYRQAIESAPDFAEAHCNLGDILAKAGRYADALAAFQRGHELGLKDPNWQYPSASWVEMYRRIVALEPQLTAILAGTETPSDPTDVAAVADVASKRKHYARAAELYRSAIAADTVAVNDLKLSRRYAGACAAARAGCGEGVNATKLDDAAREAWRRQALEWLRANLAAWQKLAATDTFANRSKVQDTLGHWQRDQDLEGIRGTSGLAKLSSTERAEWESFWVEVRDTLAKARAPSAKKR